MGVDLMTHLDQLHLPKPQLVGPPSHCLESGDLDRLREHLPIRFRHFNWHLLYSKIHHGVSINTFYLRTANMGPTVMVCRDSNDQVFGAYVSASWHISTSYYGTGETFVFSVSPEFRVHNWTRANNMFVLSKANFLSIGAGGHAAFWIDDDFHNGSSGVCATFDSPCLASKEMFTCMSLYVTPIIRRLTAYLRSEVWGLSESVEPMEAVVDPLRALKRPTRRR